VSASDSWTIVVVLALLLFLVLLAGYYAVTRLRARRQKLALELDTARDLIEDRAFNQVRIARAEAALLASRGVDVEGPTKLLADAEAARSRREFDTALALGRSAHESLVRLQRGDPASDDAPARPPAPRTTWVPESLPVGPDADDPPSGDRSDDDVVPRAGLPKNKAEARFELALLREEIGRRTDAGTADAAVAESTKMADLAGQAFDRGDFTEALRLALRGRRHLGAHLETVPPPTIAASATPTPATSEAPLACSGCGEPLRPTDRFCRFCGTLRGPARCAGCGTPLAEEDRFCAACGRPVPGAPGTS